VNDDVSNWFVREVLPHEDSLVRYLARICPNRSDVFDLRQEVYVRVFEAAKVSRPVPARPFLFTTAKHLVLDRIRRSRVVSIEPVGDPAALSIVVDEVSPERRLSSRQELKRLAAAFGALPPRCREVVWLRKVDEMSQADVANMLGISVRTVESQVQKGVRLLAQALFVDGAEARRASSSEKEATAANGSGAEDER